MSDETRCPHCAKPLAFEVLSQLTEKSRVRWKICPKPGELMNAETVGGTLVDVGELLMASAKKQGVEAEILVENITSIDGEITFHLLISRRISGIRQDSAS